MKTLKEDKQKLNDLIDYWKNKFFDILKLIKDKLFGKKEEREQYMDVANELYNKDIIDTNQFDEMYDIDYMLMDFQCTHHYNIPIHLFLYNKNPYQIITLY